MFYLTKCSKQALSESQTNPAVREVVDQAISPSCCEWLDALLPIQTYCLSASMRIPPLESRTSTARFLHGIAILAPVNLFFFSLSLLLMVVRAQDNVQRGDYPAGSSPVHIPLASPRFIRRSHFIGC
jgi:hypothetical protein